MKRKFILWSVTLTSIFGMFLVPRVSQPQNYHNFADNRTMFGIKNFPNVFSNIGFLLAGVSGLKVLQTKLSKSRLYFQGSNLAYISFFISSILVGIGSGYYHTSPNNSTLFWDRLPMSLMAMAIFGAIFIDRTSYKYGNYLLLGMQLLGAMSTAYWEYT